MISRSLQGRPQCLWASTCTVISFSLGDTCITYAASRVEVGGGAPGFCTRGNSCVPRLYVH